MNTAAYLQPEPPDIHSSTDEYATRFAGAVGGWMLMRQELSILNMFDAKNHGQALDVGGGHAQTAATLRKAGFKVTVLGSSEQCSRRLAQLLVSEQVSFTTGSLIRFPFADRTFDLVLSIRILCHMSDWRAFIAELCRVSRRTVVIDYPRLSSVNMLSDKLFALKKRVEGNTRKFALFSDADIEAEFRKYGFQVERRINQFFLPIVLHRVLRSVWISSRLEDFFALFGLRALFGSPAIVKMVRCKG